MNTSTSLRRKAALPAKLGAFLTAWSVAAGAPLAGAGTAAVGVALGLSASPAWAQGAGTGPRGQGEHRDDASQGGGGLGAVGSGPKGSGVEGDSAAPASKDDASGKEKENSQDSDAATNAEIERLYTPPPAGVAPAQPAAPAVK